MVTVWAGLITFIATTVLTLAGVGAAFILIPVYLALGIELHVAMSTALLLNSIAMLFASINFARQRLILWKLALPILIAATILSPLGAYLSQYVPHKILLALFVAFLVFAASMMLFYKPGKAAKQLRQEMTSAGAAVVAGEAEQAAAGEKAQVIIGVLVGAFAGFLGGLLGVGGGNFIVPALVWLGIQPKRASATTSFVVLFSSLSGFLGRVSLGHLSINLLLFTAAGSIAGALLGSWLLGRKLQNQQVKTAIGAILYIVAAKMLFDLLK